MRKRILSLTLAMTLALLLMMTNMSYSVFAAESDTTEYGQVVLAPAEGTKLLTVDGKPLETILVTLDGQEGYWYKIGERLDFIIEVEAGYDLIAESFNNANQGGKVDYDEEKSCYYGIVTEGENKIQTWTEADSSYSGKNAISSLENWQERMFTLMGLASAVDGGNSSDKYFEGGTTAPESTVFWFLFGTDEVDKYVDADGNFNATYKQYMNIAEAYFVNVPDMRQYLIGNGYMDATTQQVQFFMGGYGSDWDWVITESGYDGYNKVWRIKGIFCDGYLEDTTGLTEYVDYYNNLKIDSAVELTLKEDAEHGFQIASYSELDYYYVNTEEGRTIYKYDESKGNFSGIYYPINVRWYDGQTIYLVEGTYTEFGDWWCCQAGKELRWYSECAEHYIGRVELTRTEQGNTMTSVVGASGSVMGGPNIELRAIPFCQFEIDSPNATVEAIQGLEKLEDGTYGSTAPTPVKLKITANEGYKVTGVEAKEQGKWGEFAVGTYNSDKDTWEFYLEFDPDTIIVSTEKIPDNTVTIDSSPDSAEIVTVKIPVEEADKVYGLNLIVEELEPDVKEDATELIMGQLDVEKEDIHILDIYFANVDGEEVKVNANMVVTVPIPEGWNPANTAVYYINTETGEMVDMKAVISADGKTASFKTNHFSYYALVQKETSVTPNPPIIDNPSTDNPNSDLPAGNTAIDSSSTNKVSPQTGDISDLMIFVEMLFASAIVLVGMVIYNQNKKRQF